MAKTAAKQISINLEREPSYGTNLLGKTCKTLGQWNLLLSQQSFSKHGEYMTFLKSEHAITHGFANFITLKFREADAASSDADDLVANQYKGKESLTPIFNKLLMTITHLGSDVEVVAKNRQ